MILFTEAKPPELSPLISIVIEQKQEIPPPVEYTLEEKIKLNVNQCDESVEYIRADNAECLAKPLRTAQTTVSRENPVKSTVNASQTASSGWYDYGYCTWYVSTQRSVGQWNNARDWAWQAKRDGWTVSPTPIVGAIAQKNNHVAIVRQISGDQMTIQEANYEGWNIISSRTISTSGWTFIY